MEKKEELKQEKDVQQPQAAETQEATAQQKPNLITDDQVNWEELRKCGIDKEQLSEKDMKALMNYGKTGLVTVKRPSVMRVMSCKPVCPSKRRRTVS